MGGAPGRRGAWRLELHETLVSTNDDCIARAEAGEPDGLAVLARRQSGARGSRGRGWSEPPAGNLALSVLLRPSGKTEIGAWPFVAGLALLEGLESVSAASLTLKWPNDVLLGARKLAGILIERGAGAGGDWMVIGFGANLAAAPVLADRVVACLAEAGPAPGQEQAAWAVLDALDRWRAVLDAEGFAPVRQAWLRRAHPVGTRLRIGARDETVTDEWAGSVASGEPMEGAKLAIGASGAQTEGSFSGIAADGALLVVVDGVERRVETGEVLLLGGSR